MQTTFKMVFTKFLHMANRKCVFFVLEIFFNLKYTIAHVGVLVFKNVTWYYPIQLSRMSTLFLIAQLDRMHFLLDGIVPLRTFSSRFQRLFNL